MCRFVFFILIAILSPSVAFPDQFIDLKGVLNEEVMRQAEKELGSGNYQTLIVEIDSNGGNLESVLQFAAKVYELKAENEIRVIVYINDQAVGPAAVIPFLADELYTSYIVSWGDIPLGTNDTVPTNLLRNRVVSLIPVNHKEVERLRAMAVAMTDSETILVDDGKWHIAKGDDAAGKVLANANEALVVSQQDLKSAGLVNGVMSPATFQKRYAITEEQRVQQKESTTSLTVSPKNFHESLRNHIKFSEEGPNLVGYIKIGDHSSMISQSTWLFVKSAMEYYKEKKPIFIILELNTPGGEVFAAQQISDALQNIDTQESIPVVTFINDWAISAGAMLAYSTRFITVAKDGSMGAAEPVTAGEGGKMVALPEKINSALRADFANRARFFDRNSDLAEAMVDKDIILVLRNGKVVRLNSDEQIRLKGPNPDVVITEKGKLLTLTAEQLINYGVADQLLMPTRLEPITTAEKEKAQWPASKELLFQDPFFAAIPNAIVDEYHMDWKTQFFVILAMPLVSSLLFLGLLMGFYIEFNTPGFGLPGSIGLICLLLIIISNLSLEFANWLEVILMLSGIILVAVELFFIPTGGILGFVGAIFCLGGLFAIMLPGVETVDFEFDTGTVNAAGEVFFERLVWFSGTLVVAFVLMVLLTRYISPSWAGINRLVLLGHELDREAGFFAGEDPRNLPSPGSKGVVFATLRPSGKVEIAGKIYEAVTAGDFIEKGTEIIVQRLDGSVMIVEPVEEEI
ncbi:MAG: ATP-dependent Clp protease proteolytic subunit [Chlamydiales bacterium]|nr:ATP-dependent Clp protease proteolytic subunit [Chlamydiia bacterium]MCP5507306.1 ATP-dependent Clp protease proteolytic subunit [Chlamydiales bacterium]